MAQPRRPGRPPKLNKATKDQLLFFIRGGLPIETASKLAGVHATTVRHWRNKSRQGRQGYQGFEAEVQKALAEGEALHVARITDAGKSNWRASAWLLERMYPDRWAERPPTDEGDPDAPQTPQNELAGL